MASRIFVTGTSSCLSRAVLPALCASPAVEAVVGIDLREPWFRHERFRAHVLDVRSPRLRELMSGCDAVLHMAYAVMRGERSDAELHANNVAGSLGVFAAAASQGIPHVVNMSSVSVYGGGENLVETAALRPSPKFTYALHKAEIEALAAERHPQVTHLRSHLIFGRHCQPFLKQMVRSRVHIAVPAPQPRVQVVHEQDVASAILAALAAHRPGPFNLAASAPVTLHELATHGKSWAVPVPLRTAKALARVAKRLGSREESAWLNVLDTALTVDCAKAARVLGWTARFTAWDARAEMTQA